MQDGNPTYGKAVKYRYGFTGQKTMLCQLCTGRDKPAMSTPMHTLGGCTNEQMAGMYTHRHNEAMHIIRKTIEN